MYNCYFGDCFRIANLVGNDLLVDFGIHKSCTPTSVREKRFEDIYTDILDSNIDFLLSHYHEDHYNGVIYVNKRYQYKFKDIYIPDVWNFDGCIKAINLYLLRGILDKTFLKRKTSIFSFLKSICDDQKVIHFVQRGTYIQDKYIALWPSEEYIIWKALKVYESAIDKVKLDSTKVEQLEQFSKKLRRIVLDMHSRNTSSAILLQRLDTLEEEFTRFVRDINITGENISVIIKLRCFENDISIVLQNKENCTNENMIFTGDFGYDEQLWDYIENNNDKRSNCDMHPNYHVIKAGHHGTRPYYHSFIGRMNSDSILLIPNDGKRWNVNGKPSVPCNNYAERVARRFTVRF